MYVPSGLLRSIDCARDHAQCVRGYTFPWRAANTSTDYADSIAASDHNATTHHHTLYANSHARDRTDSNAYSTDNFRITERRSNCKPNDDWTNSVSSFD